MELLGDSNQQMRNMRAQLMAQQALLAALVTTLNEPQRGIVKRHFQREGEHLMADLLHSMASDSLTELLQSQLQSFTDLLDDQERATSQTA